MATLCFGQIICNNIPHSRTVRRFIEKQVHRWILRNSKTSDPTKTKYLVTLQRQEEGHGVNCRIEIYDGKTLWRAIEYSSGLHQALIRCINHLMPTSPYQPT